MDIYRIAFIGHRLIYGQYHLEDRVEEIIREKLRSKEYVELYVGRNGDFDILVASATKRAQKRMESQNSALVLVQPYSMKNDADYEKFYDEIWYPIDRKVHPKAAITTRNRWMIENADLLIAYIEEERCGGALSTLKYAQKQGIEIINLAC